LALLHFSCAATVGIRKKFHLTGGLGAKAEVPVPSLDDWEKERQENPQRSAQPRLLPVDFRSPLAAIAQSN
jgi:hypothetical protein